MTDDDDDDVVGVDAEAFTALLVKSMLRDAPGEISPGSVALLNSIGDELRRDLPDTPEELVATVLDRLRRPTVIVGLMADIVVKVIRSAERNGITVHLHTVNASYDVLLELDATEGGPEDPPSSSP